MAGDEVGGEPVGFARGRAVADRDQLGLVPGGERRQDGDALVPSALRLVRIDRRRVDDLAGRVDDRDLDAGSKPRIEADRRPAAGRRGEQEVAQVRGEHFHRLVLGLGPDAQAQVDGELRLDLRAPRPARGVEEPAVARPAAVGDAETMGDRQLEGPERAARRVGVRVGDQPEIEDLLAFAAHERERPVRGDFHQRLEEVEIVGEFRPRRLLALAHFRDDPAALPEVLAQPADEFGVLGETLDEDRARAVERLLRALDGVGLQVGFGLRERLALRMGEKRLGERLEAVLARDLRLGAPLRLERQVDVFEPRLGVGLVDLGLERSVELALFADRIEDRSASLLELAQIGETGLERAQLRVVERPGRLLAVAGDEGHGRAFVQKADRGGDLAGPDVQLLGDAFGDRFHGSRILSVDGAPLLEQDGFWSNRISPHPDPLPQAGSGSRAKTPDRRRVRREISLLFAEQGIRVPCKADHVGNFRGRA